MTEDQYILAVRGTLDRQSAAILCREMDSLLGRGYRRIVLFGERLGPVLPEGVLELRRWAQAQTETARPAALVAVHSLEGPASAQFLLHGVPVVERCAQLLPPLAVNPSAAVPESPAPSPAPERRVVHEAQLKLPADNEPGPENSSGHAGWMAHCPACHHPSRVPTPGDYACPVCGAPFRMSPSGALHALLPE